MKKHFCILFCMALLGCQDQKPTRPAHLIPESEMVRIMADIHTAEAQIETTINYPDTALMVFSSMEKEILEKHGVKEDQFRETYSYYTNNIGEMDKLYEIITDTLIAREAKYASKGEEASDEPEMIEENTLPLDSIKLRRPRRSGEAGSGELKYDN